MHDSQKFTKCWNGNGLEGSKLVAMGMGGKDQMVAMAKAMLGKDAVVMHWKTPNC